MVRIQSDLFKPDLAPEKTIRLAVSGDVFVTKTELDIINTPQFQRLRRLKQLGTSCLVFPSATHTRFEHSLGTLKMASLMIEMINKSVVAGKSSIEIEPEDEQLIRLAALLHDIPTIPFGHTLEDEITVIESNHEERYEHFLGERGKEINKVLKESLGNDRLLLLLRILSIKSKDIYSLGEHAYMRDIIKNTVCADLLDYLRRDALYCDLKTDFGDRFLRYMYISEIKDTDALDVELNPKETPKKAKRIITRLWKDKEKRHRRDLIDELIQLLNARFLLGSAVYFHHAKIITSAMLARAVDLALQRKVITKEQLLYELGDEELLYILKEKGTDEIRKLVVGVRERKLYKIFDGYSVSRKVAEAKEIPINLLDSLESKFNKDAKNRVRTEDLLCADCKKPQGDILIYCPEKDMSLKQANMLVLWKNTPQPLRKIDDELAKSKIDNIIESHENLWSLKVLVHPQIEDEIKDESFRSHLLEDCCKYRIEGDEGGGTEKLDAAVENIIIDILSKDGPSAVLLDEVRKTAHSVARGGKQLDRNEIEEIVNKTKSKES